METGSASRYLLGSTEARSFPSSCPAARSMPRVSAAAWTVPGLSGTFQDIGSMGAGSHCQFLPRGRATVSLILSSLFPRFLPAVFRERPALVLAATVRQRFAQSGYLRLGPRYRGIDARHDLGRHQLHRAPCKVRIHPVHARVHQLAEIADALAQREDAVDDLVDRSADHEPVEHEVGGQLSVRLIGAFLEYDVAVRTGELGLKLMVVEAIRARRILAAIGGCGPVVVGNEHGPRDAPIGRIGREPGLALAFGVIRPVRGQPVRHEEVRRQRMEVALAHFDDGATTVPTISGRGFCSGLYM